MSSGEKNSPEDEGGSVDPMSGSLNMSASSSTIAAALSSSANMGGKAVTISLPTQAPKAHLGEIRLWPRQRP
jgi:hypothetical protein